MSTFGGSGAPETLYHYCDAYAFESIVRTNQLWLCPFVYSNDTMEGQACRDVLRNLGVEAKMADHSIDQFIAQLDLLREVIECFGMSLSEKGDVLSQWRGYAADGAGFAIGLDRGMLNQMPELPGAEVAGDLVGLGPKLVKVEYDEPQAAERLRGLFESAKQHIPASGTNNMPTRLANPAAMDADRRAINFTLFNQWHQLFSIKGPAFLEEREWRLAFTGFPDNPLYNYRVSRGMVAPYLKYDMPKVESGECPIAEIVIGPKNPTPASIVHSILQKYGHRDVKVYKSAASYR